MVRGGRAESRSETETLPSDKGGCYEGAEGQKGGRAEGRKGLDCKKTFRVNTEFAQINKYNFYPTSAYSIAFQREAEFVQNDQSIRLM